MSLIVFQKHWFLQVFADPGAKKQKQQPEKNNGGEKISCHSYQELEERKEKKKKNENSVSAFCAAPHHNTCCFPRSDILNIPQLSGDIPAHYVIPKNALLPRLQQGDCDATVGQQEQTISPTPGQLWVRLKTQREKVTGFQCGCRRINHVFITGGLIKVWLIDHGVWSWLIKPVVLSHM